MRLGVRISPAVRNLITQVWNPCTPLLLHTMGNYDQGVEPLCPFSSVHCIKWGHRCGTPVPLFYSAL